MAGGPQLGHGMPKDESWISRKFEDYGRELTELRAAQTPQDVTVGGLANMSISAWPATTSTTFTTIAAGYIEAQNMGVTYIVELYSDAGGVSTFQMLANGTQIGTTQTVGASTSVTWNEYAAYPSGTATGSLVYVEMQAMTTATSYSAHGQCLRLAGYPVA